MALNFSNQSPLQSTSLIKPGSSGILTNAFKNVAPLGSNSNSAITATNLNFNNLAPNAFKAVQAGVNIPQKTTLTSGQTKAANNIPPTVKTPSVTKPPVQAAATFNPSQVAGLNAAAQRKANGTATATDLKNLSYAQSKGWTPTITPIKTTPVTPTVSPTTPVTPTAPVAPVVSDTQTKLDELYKTIIGSIKPSETETKTAEQLAQTNQAMREGLLNTENQVIPMEFITGQQASISKAGTNKAQTLQDQLTNLQTQRNANLAAATAGAGILGTKQTTDTAQREFENTLATSGYKPYTTGIMLKSGEKTVTLTNPITGESKQYIAPAAAPKEISAGASLYDPTTGKIIAQAPTNTEMTEYQKAQLAQNETITPYQQAQLEIERAKAGLSTGKADPVKLEQVNRQLDLLDEIESSPDLASVTGFSSLYSGLIPGTSSYDLKAKIDSLKSNLTLGNMGVMKGVLSDSDMKVISQASSALKVGMSEEGFKNELSKIRNQFNQALQRAMGTGTETKTDGWF